MGGDFSKFYLPTNYAMWIRQTGFKKINTINDGPINDAPMNEDIYKKYILDDLSRNNIKEIADYYADAELKIKENKQMFLSLFLDPENDIDNIAPCILYDHLVGNIFCKFWIELIDQPRESILTYYKINEPNVKQPS